MKPRRKWSLPTSIRRLFRLADSSHMGDAIADMLDPGHDLDEPCAYNDRLRAALRELKTAARINCLHAAAAKRAAN